MITAILNGYKRPHVLDEQVEALKRQTTPPEQIMVWYNHPGSVPLNKNIGQEYTTAYSTENLGVWARFFYAFNARNPYVVVFDDDTVPGDRWLENCMSTMVTHEGLLGTIGLKFRKGETDYTRYQRLGWNGPIEVPEEVDFVGHSWFFKKEWLQYFVRDLPNTSYYNVCGEDMHFSYMLQKYANIPTYVPPHPVNDKSLWGSIKGEEQGYGNSPVSIWVTNQNNARTKMNEFFRLQRKDGWELVNERS